MKHKKPFGKHDFHLRSELLNIYFVVSYLLILGLCGNYLTTLVFPDTRSFLFAIAVYLSYGIIYLLPTILLTKTIHFVLSRNTRKNDISRWRKVWVYGVAVVMTSATGLSLFVDQMIFRLYGFHLNGFVWNLIITPGGIESMG